jgi:hypothetical protein
MLTILGYQVVHVIGIFVDLNHQLFDVAVRFSYSEPIKMSDGLAAFHNLIIWVIVFEEMPNFTFHSDDMMVG